LTETWQLANEYNTQTFIKLQKPVAKIRSTGRGRKHVKNAFSQIGQLPLNTIVSIGSRVILTKNQDALTPYGLNNGAMGTVITILYEEGKRPPLQTPLCIVVDFPKYSGPAWLHNHPTWVPIVTNDGRCESNCCFRQGFPLLPGYALTIPKCQGMTVGKGKMCENMIIKLTEDTHMENTNLGQAYTAFSRCSEESDWALDQQISWERLQTINDHKDMKSRANEEKRLEELAQKTMEKIDCTIPQYLSLLNELDAFANDGIQDSICTDPSDTCKCCFHNR
jgi:ATP-dependent exoDNAse (exonuclease V) alpha subunit